MSTQQVPEGVRNQVLAQIQSPTFRDSVRGKLNPQMVDMLITMMEGAESRHQLNKDLDTWFRTIKGTTTTAFGIRGQGGDINSAVANQSMKQRNTTVFPFEPIEEDKLVPVTLLMLDPERTLLMMRWICGQANSFSHWTELDTALDQIDTGHDIPHACRPL